MTISSLAKMLVGVNNIVVENLDFSANDNEIVIENLSETYRAKLQQILLRDRRLATAYRLKEDLRLIFKMDISEVSAALEKWRRRAWSCRIPQFVELQPHLDDHASLRRSACFSP